MSSWMTAPTGNSTPAPSTGPGSVPSGPTPLGSAAPPVPGGTFGAAPAVPGAGMSFPSSATSAPNIPSFPGGSPSPVAAPAFPSAQTTATVGLDEADGPIGKAPIWVLFVALTLALIAGVLATLFGNFALIAFATWFLAGPVAIAVLAWFTLKDTKVRAGGPYDERALPKILYWVAMVAAFIAVLIAAWRIGVWVGHL